MKRDHDAVEGRLPGLGDTESGPLGKAPKSALSALQIIEEYDNVPLPHQFDPAAQKACIDFFADLWAFKVGDSASTAQTFGYMHPWVVERLPWPPECVEVHKSHKVVLVKTPGAREDPGTISGHLATMLQGAIEAKAIPKELLPRKLRKEQYPVIGAPVPVTVDRAASPMFGLVQRSSFLVCYVRDPSAPHGLRFWVPRRAYHRSAHPGKLDTTAAGGMEAGEEPLGCIAREAFEEVGLDEGTVLREARAVGTYTWYTFRRMGVFGDVEDTPANRRLAEKVGLIYPSVSFMFEMEVPADWKPKLDANEVGSIQLWTVDEVKAAIGAGEYKSTTAMVMFHFFIRWGFMTAANEPDYEEIIQRLHRRLPFPCRPKAKQSASRDS